MMTFRNTGRTLFLLPIVASIFMAACGGGNSGATAPTPPGEASTTTGQNTGTVSGSTYVVTWDQVADPSVTGYKLYYATDPYTSGTNIYTIDVGAPTTYLFTPSTLGLTAGTTIYFAVASVGNGMESPLSDVVTVVLQ